MLNLPKRCSVCGRRMEPVYEPREVQRRPRGRNPETKQEHVQTGWACSYCLHREGV